MDGLVPATGQGDGAREGAEAGVWQGRASGGVGSVGCGDQEAPRGVGGSAPPGPTRSQTRIPSGLALSIFKKKKFRARK